MMELSPEQQEELESRYMAAQAYHNQTISFDQAQTIRAKYFAELRASGTAKESVSTKSAKAVVAEATTGDQDGV